MKTAGKYTVLVVTNDRLTALDITRDLESEGYVVELANFNGNNISLKREKYDAVLFDGRLDIYTAVGVRHMTGRPVIPLTIGLERSDYEGWPGTFETPVDMPWDPKVLLAAILQSIQNAPQSP